MQRLLNLHLLRALDIVFTVMECCLCRLPSNPTHQFLHGATPNQSAFGAEETNTGQSIQQKDAT